jgi:carboxymethylenebutenolidase
MCYPTSARPPFPPIAGGDGTAAGDLELTSADGTRFGAFSATTDAENAPGMVILPDVRGLHAFYKDLAVRFAEAGIHATTFDYFGRTAAIGARSDDFEWMPHVAQTTPDRIADDVAAAVAHVRSAEGGGASSVLTVGFCFGGRNSFNQAARGQGLAGVVGFYGVVGARGRYPEETAPIRLAPGYECPVLGLFGGADQGIPPEDVEEFGRVLDAAGVEHDLHIYDRAPHSFFDRAFDQFKSECDDAWRRILAFVAAHTG